MATMNISLPDPMRDWVESRLNSGQYASVSDYVRDLIRHDQEDAEKRQALTRALIEGEESGISDQRMPEIIEMLRKERRGANG